MEKQKLVDQFNKNSVEIVKVHLQEWRGNPYFDVRSWILDKPGENGSERPTHKGITLNVELLPRLIQALNEAQRSLNEREMPEKMRDMHQEKRSHPGQEKGL